MTKKYEDNRIETVEGEYVENTNSVNNESTPQPKKSKSRFLKPIIIGALAVVVTGGVGAYAYDKYEQNKRAKVQEAYSKVKMNVDPKTESSNSNNNSSSNTSDSTSDAIKKATDEGIKNIANNVNKASSEQPKFLNGTISQDEVKRIVAEAISTPQDQITFTSIEPKLETDYALQNNGQGIYIYDVEGRANGLEYEVHINAETGKVLKVDIDN